jgi:lysophospholipid acyltransferase (LPLAT)-like uncharacterized protein
MELVKRIGRSEGGRDLLAALITGYIRFVHRTCRWTVIGAPTAFWEARRPFLATFWHGRLLMVPLAWQGDMKISMLQSAHRDGLIMEKVIGSFGIGSIKGSSSKGGSSGMRGMLRALRGGDCVGITPDFPPGPANVVGEGIIAIARLGDVPIVPLTYSTSRRWMLGTWDRFQLPLPFGRGVLLWGEPLFIPRDAGPEGIEVARRELEQRMNAMNREADRICGWAAPEPAAPAAIP